MISYSRTELERSYERALMRQMVKSCILVLGCAGSAQQMGTRGDDGDPCQRPATFFLALDALAVHCQRHACL